VLQPSLLTNKPNIHVIGHNWNCGGTVLCHCGKRTAGNDSLSHFLTTQMNDPAATTAQKLNLLVLNKHVGDMAEFMLKVTMNLAVIERKNNRHFITGHFDKAGADQVGATSQATPILDAQSKMTVLSAEGQAAKSPT
jgi:hypothetical protein